MQLESREQQQQQHCSWTQRDFRRTRKVRGERREEEKKGYLFVPRGRRRRNVK